MSDTNIITGETRIEDMQSRHVLEKSNIDNISGTDIPNVLNRKIIVLDNTVPITIIDFKNGAPGQRIYLLGDGNTTIDHGTFIFTNTGADKLLVVNKVYKFTFFPIKGPPKSHKWVEDE